MFLERYGDVFKGPKQWQAIEVTGGTDTYTWPAGSTYVKNPPYFDGITHGAEAGHRHQSCPHSGAAGRLHHHRPYLSGRQHQEIQPGGRFLSQHQVLQKDFNSYGARRGNDDVMVRGTFANIRIKNEMLDGVEGGMTKHFPSGDELSIYDAADAL